MCKPFRCLICGLLGPASRPCTRLQAPGRSGAALGSPHNRVDEHLFLSPLVALPSLSPVFLS